jgi:hypothetical protein
LGLNRRIATAVFMTLLLGGTALAAGTDTFEGFRVVGVIVNGKEVKSDVPAINFNGRTLMPIRAVAEMLGAKVDWNEETWTATLTTPDVTALQAEKEKLSRELAEAQTEIGKLKDNAPKSAGSGKIWPSTQPWETVQNLYVLNKTGDKQIATVPIKSDNSFDLGPLASGEYLLYGVQRSAFFNSDGESQDADVLMSLEVIDGKIDSPINLPLFITPPKIVVSTVTAKPGETVQISLASPEGPNPGLKPEYFLFSIGGGDLKTVGESEILGSGGTLTAYPGKEIEVPYKDEKAVAWQATAKEQSPYPVTTALMVKLPLDKTVEIATLTSAAPGEIKLLLTDPTGNIVLREITVTFAH